MFWVAQTQTSVITNQHIFFKIIKGKNNGTNSNRRAGTHTHTLCYVYVEVNCWRNPQRSTTNWMVRFDLHISILMSTLKECQLIFTIVTMIFWTLFPTSILRRRDSWVRAPCRCPRPRCYSTSETYFHNQSQEEQMKRQVSCQFDCVVVTMSHRDW